MDLPLFYRIIDLQGYRKWDFLFVAVGINSILFYCSRLTFHWRGETLETPLGQEILDGPFGPMWEETSFALFILAIGYWMYETRIFIRI